MIPPLHILAHGPGAEIILPTLLLFLALGAVLPPCLYLRPQPSRSWGWRALRLLLAALLNIYGLFVYANMAWHLGEMEFETGNTPGFMLLALGPFVTVELCVLRHRHKALRRPRT